MKFRMYVGLILAMAVVPEASAFAEQSGDIRELKLRDWQNRRIRFSTFTITWAGAKIS